MASEALAKCAQHFLKNFDGVILDIAAGACDVAAFQTNLSTAHVVAHLPEYFGERDRGIGFENLEDACRFTHDRGLVARQPHGGTAIAMRRPLLEVMFHPLLQADDAIANGDLHRQHPSATFFEAHKFALRFVLGEMRKNVLCAQ